MSVQLVCRALLLMMLLPGLSLQAHHAFTGYSSARVTLDGTVKSFEWTNPHIWIRVLVTDTNGQIVEWGVESAAVAVAKRMGFTFKSLKPGDKVQVIIHPRADGSKIGSFIQVTLPDGTAVKGRDELANDREHDRRTDGLPSLSTGGSTNGSTTEAAP